jgi:hypothetical protein
MHRRSRIARVDQLRHLAQFLDLALQLLDLLAQLLGLAAQPFVLARPLTKRRCGKDRLQLANRSPLGAEMPHARGRLVLNVAT